MPIIMLGWGKTNLYTNQKWAGFSVPPFCFHKSAFYGSKVSFYALLAQPKRENTPSWCVFLFACGCGYVRHDLRGYEFEVAKRPEGE